jgi:hypothetical protein
MQNLTTIDQAGIILIFIKRDEETWELFSTVCHSQNPSTRVAFLKWCGSLLPGLSGCFKSQRQMCTCKSQAGRRTEGPPCAWWGWGNQKVLLTEGGTLSTLANPYRSEVCTCNAGV